MSTKGIIFIESERGKRSELVGVGGLCVVVGSGGETMAKRCAKCIESMPVSQRYRGDVDQANHLEEAGGE